jgi:protease-4
MPRYQEQWSYGHRDGAKVVRIPVQGIIARQDEDGLFSPQYDRVESILRQIRAASEDRSVRGIILEVNSPGGAVTPSDEILYALKRFKQRGNRKIVVFMQDVAASGGYMVSMAGDWLIAEPTSIVGSIGVILQTLNWRVLSERVGLTDVTFISGDRKDTLNPFREVTDAERAMMQGIVDDIYQHFFNIVLEGRNMSEEMLTPLADGSIFMAAEAMSRGLIDDVGYWNDVLAAMLLLLDEDHLYVVRYEESDDFWGWLSRVKSPLPLWGMFRQDTSPFRYQWSAVSR